MIPPDQDDRTRAWQCFDRSVDVAAGAGTGKTRVLVDRYLAWTLAEAWRRDHETTASQVVGTILAITFTEKAAGEMQERIGRSLRVIAGERPHGLGEHEIGYVRSLAEQMCAHFGVDAPVLTERARAVLEQAHRMEVSTIHSFAARVLRTYPLEAGIHPDFQVDIDGSARRKLLEQAFIERTREGLAGEQSALFAELLLGVGQERLLALLGAILNADADLDHLTPAPDLTGLAAACAELVAIMGPHRGAVRGSSRGKYERIFGDLSLIAGRLTEDAAAIAADPRGTLGELDREALDRLKRDLKGFPPDTVGRLFGRRREAFEAQAAAVRVAASELLSADPALFARVADGYRDVLAGVRSQLRASGILSFDDLLSLTERLLVDQPRVARALADRYGQLLVDEFQDTNPGQCTILSALAGADPGQARLFVVGDPKQSIYAFRQADLAAYERFTADLDERLVLRANFRSQAALVDVLNQAFDRLFVAVPELQPGPQALAATRPAREDLPAVEVWKADDPGGDKRTADQAREVEAEAMLRAIVALDASTPHEPGRRWSRFAVLSRVQSEVTTVVDRLEAAGIPCIVTGDKEFYRRQEVLDTVNLLRVIVDPADAVAWVGLLRSPLGAVPDPVLLDLARARFFTGTHPHNSVRQALAKADRQHAEHLRRVGLLVQALADLRHRLFDGPIDEWLDALTQRLPLPDLHATEYLGERKAANVKRVLHGFQRAVVEGTPLREWLDEVAQNLAGRADESESALADDTTDAVRLMSIHASKGLQFEHVFVPRLDWSKAGGEGDDVTVLKGEQGWVMRVSNPRAGVPDHTTWGLAALRAAADAVDQAETLRLLYVACTRARETLTLLGRTTRGSLTSLVKKGFLPLAKTDPRLEVHFAEAVHADVTAAPAGGEAVAAEHLVEKAARWWAEREAGYRAAQGRDLTRTASGAEPDHDGGEVDLDFDQAPAGVLVEAGQGDLFAPAAPDGGGAELGIEVHRLLELWDGGGIDLTGASEEASALVAGLLASPLAERFRAARRVLREMPFVTGGDPTEVGVIDLLLETDDGWLVVDYKTNRVADPHHARLVAERYRLQAEMYTRAVRRALGVERVGFELWFLRGPWAVPLSCG